MTLLNESENENWKKFINKNVSKRFLSYITPFRTQTNHCGKQHLVFKTPNIERLHKNKNKYLLVAETESFLLFPCPPLNLFCIQLKNCNNQTNHKHKLYHTIYLRPSSRFKMEDLKKNPTTHGLVLTFICRIVKPKGVDFRKLIRCFQKQILEANVI